jgi:hypothetical protein
MMCRFKSSADDGYIKVKGVVSKYLGEIREIQLGEQRSMFSSFLIIWNPSLCRAKSMREQGSIKNTPVYWTVSTGDFLLLKRKIILSRLFEKPPNSSNARQTR